MIYVKIKPEYCESKEETDMIYIIIEDNDVRCMIRPVEFDGIAPIENIDKYMLDIIS